MGPLLAGDKHSKNINLTGHLFPTASDIEAEVRTLREAALNV